MSQQTRENLIQVKLALSEKYNRLAAQAKSEPKKKAFGHRAEKFRRQAAELAKT